MCCFLVNNRTEKCSKYQNSKLCPMWRNLQNVLQFFQHGNVHNNMNNKAEKHGFLEKNLYFRIFYRNNIIY
jgi:hypothetical protein